jgi:DNA-binding transcriptional LysR family regulator
MTGTTAQDPQLGNSLLGTRRAPASSRSSDGAPRPRRPDSATARWQSIELRHLAALAAVARERSFRRAADELGYVQSAISGQIAHLERAAGARLFERASGTPLVELTDAGRVLLRHTEEILSRFDSAQADIGSLDHRGAAVVRVAGLEHLAPVQAAAAVSAFRGRHPFARVRFESGLSHADRISSLASGDLDVLIDTSPRDAASAPLGTVLLEDPYVLITASGELRSHQLGPVSLDELKACRPLIAGAAPERDRVAAALAALGVEPDASIQASATATVQTLVAAGFGSAIVRGHSPLDSRLVARDLSQLIAPLQITFTTAAATHASPAVAAFTAAVLDVIGCGEPLSAAAG